VVSAARAYARASTSPRRNHASNIYSLYQ
jgi:hypothetical protein